MANYIGWSQTKSDTGTYYNNFFSSSKLQIYREKRDCGECLVTFLELDKFEKAT